MTPAEWQSERSKHDALIRDSSQLGQETNARTDENDIRAKAKEEAQFGQRTSEGVIATDNDFVTPSMRLLVDRYTLPFQSWKARAAGQLEALSALIESQRAVSRSLENPDRGDDDPAGEHNDEDDRLEKDPIYIDFLAKHQTASRNYDKLKSYNEGRDARSPWPIRYVAILLLIGIAEVFVNYSTFSQRFVPFFAAATTIIIAAIVAINSDLVGKHLKQRKVARARALAPESPVLLMLTSGAFVLALAIILWARYSYYAEQIGLGEQTLEGVDTSGQLGFVLANIFPTLLINLLIWAVGVFVASQYHESVPHFREEYSTMRKLAARMRDLRQASDRRKQIQREDADIRKGARSQERSQAGDMLSEMRAEKKRIDEVVDQVEEAHARACDQICRRYAVIFTSVLIDEGIDPTEIGFKAAGGVQKSVAEWRAHFARS